MVAAAITGHGQALPPAMAQQALWDDCFAERYRNDGTARAIWERSGVVRRHGVADPRVDDISAWSTEQRMRRFVAEALPLAKEAVSAALDDAGLRPEQVGQLTVASCTGYATPGLDILLARDLGMGADTQRLHVGHMGCYAAIPSLAAVADAASSRGLIGLLCCVELTSLHVQPPPPDGDLDLQQVVAHALFSDAAAAVAVTPGGAGFEVVDIAARTATDRADLMTWDVTDLGFRMGLSPQIPDVLGAHVTAAVDELLARHGVDRQAVAGWVVHPGGPRIIDVVAERLRLDDEAVADSRAVLAEHGNCSSTTVLLILQRLRRRGLPAGAPIVALAFGPGLTLAAALLRAG